MHQHLILVMSILQKKDYKSSKQQNPMCMSSKNKQSKKQKQPHAFTGNLSKWAKQLTSNLKTTSK